LQLGYQNLVDALCVHLCVWVYNGFAISSIYQKKKKKK